MRGRFSTRASFIWRSTRWSGGDVLAEAIEEARRFGDEPTEGRAAIGLGVSRHFTDPQGTTDELARIATEWIPRFEALDDHAGLARAHYALAQIGWTRMVLADACAHFDLAAAHARLAGETHREFEAAYLSVRLAWRGPEHRDAVAERVVRFERLVGTSIAMRWAVVASAGYVAALDDRLEDARRLLAEAQELARAVGDPQAEWLEEHDGTLAELEGAWAESEDLFTSHFEYNLSRGDAGHASTGAAMVARAAAMQGKFTEALTWADRSEQLGSPDDVIDQILRREARALTLPHRGQPEAAETQAREARSIADATDAPYLQADARLGLVRVLELAGKPDEAIAALRQVSTIARRKGDRARERIVNERLAELGVENYPHTEPGPEPP